MDQILGSGIVFSRWAPDFFLGYGYPIFNYYAPLTYYAAEIFHLMGFGYIDSMKLLAAAVLSLSAVAAYLYARDIVPRYAAFVVGIAYAFTPYYLADLFVRAAMAEFVAFLWFPAILWAYRRLTLDAKPAWFILSALFYAALILTHNIAALLFTPPLIVYVLMLTIGRLRTKARDRGSLPSWQEVVCTIAMSAGAALLAVGLTCFFWLPVLAEGQYVNLASLRVYQPYVDSHRLFSSSPIHRYSYFAREGFQFGLVQVLLAMAGVASIVLGRRRLSPAARIEGLFSLALLLAVLAINRPEAEPLWEALRLPYVVQFPWRFLMLAALPSAFLAGTAIAWVPPRLSRLAVLLLVPLLILCSTLGISLTGPYLSEGDFTPANLLLRELSQAIGTTANEEYMPLWVKQVPPFSEVAKSILRDEPAAALYPGALLSAARIELVERRPTAATYRAELDEAATVSFNVTYFPGWTLFVDGVAQTVQASEPRGMVTASLPSGEYWLRLEFRETALRRSANLVSLGSLSSLVFWCIACLMRGRRALAGLGGRAWLFGSAALSVLASALPLALLAGVLWLVASACLSAAKNPQGLLNLGPDPQHKLDLMAYEWMTKGPEEQKYPRLAAGEPARLRLWLRCPEETDVDSLSAYLLEATLKARMVSWSLAQIPLVAEGERWNVGDIITKELELPIPVGTPPRAYEVIVRIAPSDAAGVDVSAALRENPFAWNKAYVGPVIVEPSSQLDLGPGGSRGKRQSVRFQNGLALVGFDASVTDEPIYRQENLNAPVFRAEPVTITAGETIALDLLWRAASHPVGSYYLSARLVDPVTGFPYAIRDEDLACGLYSTEFWESGELVRGFTKLAIPSTTPPGPYSLEVQLWSKSGALGILDDHGVPAGISAPLGTVLVTAARRPPSQVELQMERLDTPLSKGGLRLLGYNLDRRTIAPGHDLRVELFWETDEAIDEHLSVKLDLIDAEEKVWVSLTSSPGDPKYPTPRWVPHQILRQQYSITLPANTPPGVLSIIAGLLSPADQAPAAVALLDAITVSQRELRPSPPSPANVLTATFGDCLELMGFDLSLAGNEIERPFEAVAGKELRLTLHWKALREMRTSYYVSVQLWDADGHMVAQHDSLPEEGKSPTTGLLSGDVIMDGHTLSLLPQLATGTYTLVVIVYDQKNGERLRTGRGEDHIKVGSILLRP